jgi:hypothetical protein
MTAVQLTLLGIAASASIALLILWVKRKDARHRSAALAREQRIVGVVNRYRELVRTLESSNLAGMLKAGVLGLATGDEVDEACRRIQKEGLTPAIPATYREELGTGDPLVFFKLLQLHQDQMGDDAVVRQLARQAKEESGA